MYHQGKMDWATMSHIIGEPRPRDSSNQVYNTRCALFLIAVAEKRNPISTFRIALIYSFKKGNCGGVLFSRSQKDSNPRKNSFHPKGFPADR